MACEHARSAIYSPQDGIQQVFQLQASYKSNTHELVGDVDTLTPVEETLFPNLETHKALTASAHNQGRTVHDQAEHIIRAHLASVDEATH